MRTARRAPDGRHRELIRLAYLVLPSGGKRVYRLAIARRIVDRALPPGRGTGRRGRHSHTRVRTRVLGRAMRPGRLLRVGLGPWLRRLPPRLPDPRITDLLAGLDPAARAAYVLRRMEGLPQYAVRDQLVAAGVADPAGALAEAGALPDPPVRLDDLVVGDPVRHRSRMPVVAASVLTIALMTALVVMRTGGSPAPAQAHRAAPVTVAAADAWKHGPRSLDVWPARGDLVRDEAFLRSAVAAWNRKGGAPAARPQLLFAGRSGGTGTALLRDGRRIARYSGARGNVQVFTAGTDASSPMALGGGRFLLAPWTTQVLALTPQPEPVRITDGVTDPVPAGSPGPAAPGAAPTVQAATAPAAAAAAADAHARCAHGPVLELHEGGTSSTVMDLGGLMPAEVAHRTPPDIRLWDRLACEVPRPSSSITTASVWEFWSGPLPDGGGTAHWVCSRFGFLNGHGEAVSTLVDGLGAVHHTGDCGAYGTNAVGGTWWRSPRGRWHYLAAAGPGLVPRVAGLVRVTGGSGRGLVAEARGRRSGTVRVTLSAHRA